MDDSKLVNCAAVFLSENVERTVQYYQDVLGFRVVTHYENPEKFAAMYRDDIEIVVVLARFGPVLPNRRRYGAGYDAYLDPATVEGVDGLYQEFRNRGAVILNAPSMTAYGSYEFILEDIDSRQVCIGRIKQKEVFFGDKA